MNSAGNEARRMVQECSNEDYRMLFYRDIQQGLGAPSKISPMKHTTIANQLSISKDAVRGALHRIEGKGENK